MSDRTFTLICCAFVFILALAVTSDADFEDQQMAQQHYCDMTRIYEETGGEAGWPPYRQPEGICDGH